MTTALVSAFAFLSWAFGTAFVLAARAAHINHRKWLAAEERVTAAERERRTTIEVTFNGRDGGAEVADALDRLVHIDGTGRWGRGRWGAA